MYSELNMWTKRQELQRELTRLDLLTEAKAAAAEKQSSPSIVPQRLRSLATGRLSPLRLLARSA